MEKNIKAIFDEAKKRDKKLELARFYNLQSILGNDWALFYAIIGGRMTGKSYGISEFFIKQYKKYDQNVKNYWLRISETSTNALLANKASKLFDPDLQRKYNLEITKKNNVVFDHGKRICEVYPLSQFGKLKGVGFFDKDFDGYYNIMLDEFQLEQGEKRTSFDILYNFIGMLENLVRTNKSKVRVFLVGNTLEEASTILKAFNFIPNGFGRYYLKSKRCVIDNLAPTEEYLKDRKGSIADILGGDTMSNYTNKLTHDTRLIKKDRKSKIRWVIKFSKNKDEWYVVTTNNIVKRYKGQPIPLSQHIAMRAYLDSFYDPQRKKDVINMYDCEILKFDSLITYQYFTDALKRVRAS